MNKIIIANYIKRITKEDIINFSLNQNIHLSNQEVDIIYFYIKNKYKDFLNGNHESLLEEIKPKLSKSTYNKISEFYELYKNKL